MHILLLVQYAYLESAVAYKFEKILPKYMRRLFIVAWILAAVSFQKVFSQMNTPAGAAYPFPQNVTYAYGVQPTNANSNDAIAAYNTWRNDFAVSCPNAIKQPTSVTRYRIKYDDVSQTVSEGIGYGMLLAAYAADKALFDGLWMYYKDNMNSRNVMNWKISGCSGVAGENGATDAEEDVAMALYVAYHQWGTSGIINYLEELKELINTIKVHEVEAGTYVLKPGDAWGGSDRTNPSYLAPAYYKMFKEVTNDFFWDHVTEKSYQILTANAHPTTALVSDWCNGDGVPSGSYYYDATRNPWRMAMDYLWYGDTRANAFMVKNAEWLKGVGASNVKDGYNLDGSPTGTTHHSVFISTFACGVMASNSSYQSLVNDFYTENVNVSTPGYFSQILRVIGLFMQTGNFYLPPLGPPPPQCSSPNLGADRSLCGTSGSVTLNSGLSAHPDRTFKWYNLAVSNTSVIGTSPSFNVTEAGVYLLQVDSASCTRTDTVVVSATLPEPVLGADRLLCKPASFNLEPENASSFPSGTSWQWYKDGVAIDNATTYALSNVREAGVYRLTASISGCSSTFDELAITSKLAAPVDNCRSTAGAVTLGVTGGTGPFTWYGSPTGGAALGTGASFTTLSISETTTYYVQEGSGGITGHVGPASNAIGAGWYTSDFSYKLKFDALTDITLNSITVYPGTVGDITIRVLNSDLTTVLESKTFSNVGTGEQVLELNFTIPQGADYYIDALGTVAQLFLNSAGAAFPYTLTDAISIKAPEPGWITAQGWYTYFYNWSVTVGNGCERLPVIASIGSNCTPPAELEIIGPETASFNETVTYTVAAEPGTEYIWSVTGDAQIISGQGTNTIVVKFGVGDASISVVATNSNGSTSSVKNVTVQIVTGVSSEYYQPVKIYPNPFNSEFSMDLSSLTGNVLVKVYDMKSNNLVEQKRADSGAQIYLGGDYPSGLYIIEVISDNVNHKYKLVKQ